MITVRRTTGVAVLLAVVGAFAGCRQEIEVEPRTAPVVVQEDPAEGATTYRIQGLGLTFALPESFEVQDDAYYLFSSLSRSPRSFVSIMGEEPEVIEWPVRPGETLADVTIDGVSTVVAKNSPVERLPPGIVAYELRVANAGRSFSLIMSAHEDDIDALWDPFLASVHLEAA